MKVRRPVVKTDVGFCKADHEVVIEGAEHLATGVVGNHEGYIGLGVQLAVAPDFAIDLHTTTEFVERVKRADEDFSGHGEFALISYQFWELGLGKSETRRLQTVGGQRCDGGVSSFLLAPGVRCAWI